MLDQAFEAIAAFDIRSLLFAMLFVMYWAYGPRARKIRWAAFGALAAVTAVYALVMPNVTTGHFVPVLVGLYMLYFRPWEPVKPSSVWSTALSIGLMALVFVGVFRPSLASYTAVAAVVILAGLWMRSVMKAKSAPTK
jgi:hypothetical protein